MRWLSGVCVGLLLAAPAGAGIEMDLEARRLDRDRPSESATVLLAGKRLATRVPEGNGDEGSYRLIFRGDRDVLWILDEERRTFFEVDPTTANQVAGLKKSVQEGLETLSPERREALGKLLGDLMPEEPPPQQPVQTTARGDKEVILGYACEWYDVAREGEKVLETCVADWEQGELTRANLAAVPALAGFLNRTLEPLLAQFPGLRRLSPLALLAELPGLPLLTRTFENGAARTETAVTRLERKQLGTEPFRIPEGYQQSLLPPRN
jgi:hypothetical protein